MSHEEKDEKPQPANEEHGAPPDAPPLSGRVAVITIVILLILAVVVAIAGIVPRVRARTRLTQQTNALAAPAIAGALLNATGKVARRLPLKPEYVQALLKV